MSSNAEPVVLPFPTSATCPARCDVDEAPSVADARRGVRWVLGWAVVWAVLAWTGATSTAFCYRLAAEQSLARAAAAGLREATCQSATSRSVEQSVRHHLASANEHRWPVTVVTQQNGAIVSGVVGRAASDVLTVRVSVPAASVVPGWVRLISGVGDDALTAIATKASTST